MKELYTVHTSDGTRLYQGPDYWNALRIAERAKRTVIVRSLNPTNRWWMVIK